MDSKFSLVQSLIGSRSGEFSLASLQWKVGTVPGFHWESPLGSRSGLGFH